MNGKVQFKFDRLLAAVALCAILVMAIGSNVNAQATGPKAPSTDESSTPDHGSLGDDAGGSGNWNQVDRNR